MSSISRLTYQIGLARPNLVSPRQFLIPPSRLHPAARLGHSPARSPSIGKYRERGGNGVCPLPPAYVAFGSREWQDVPRREERRNLRGCPELIQRPALGVVD